MGRRRRSETPANLLNDLGANFMTFSEWGLILLEN